MPARSGLATQEEPASPLLKLSVEEQLNLTRSIMLINRPDAPLQTKKKARRIAEAIDGSRSGGGVGDNLWDDSQQTV